MDEPKKTVELKVKITDDIAKGTYANNAMIVHSPEEFIMDFINMTPTGGMVTSRIIISPPHAKRLLKALTTNVQKYEQQFGEIRIFEKPKDEIKIVH